MSPSADEPWMRHALALAELGRGAVEPNPLVGAVVVGPGGELLGEGWHRRYGQAHAEVNALAAAGDRARGATLFVTLEPCCHHGKTPPCTDAVLAAGVSRVVAAMADPFPQVSGRGAEILRRAGLAVEVGLCEGEARRLNAPYLKLLSARRPYVHLKWAMTLDGKIATHTGDSKWISCHASRHLVHDLRGRVDAVVVGIGTALADDPQLTARPAGPRVATRVVLDSHARLPPHFALVRTAREAPTLVVTSEVAPAEATRPLLDAGCEVLRLPGERPSVAALLDELGRRRFTNVLVEGGGGVAGAFLDAGEVDEVHVFLAPRLAGGDGAKSPIGGAGTDRIADAARLSRWEMKQIDDDVYIHGWR